MVQVDDSISYDPDMGHNGEAAEDWGASVQEAVAAFGRQVHESSRQLVSAAERFAGESSRTLDEASRKAEAAAENAAAALAEVRALTADLQAAIAAAVEQVQQDMTTHLQQSTEDAVRQIESLVANARTLAASAENAAQEARQAASDASAEKGLTAGVAEATAEAVRAAAGEIVSLRAALSNTERLAQEARQLASEAREVGDKRDTASAVAEAAAVARSAAEEVASLRAAVSGAERAAEEAKQVALEATALAQHAAAAPPAEPALSIGAQEVLERLEADYSLLTKLVQELHARIASLSSHTAPVYQFVPPSEREPLTALEAPAEAEVAQEDMQDGLEVQPEDEEAAPAGWEQTPTPAASSWDIARFASEAGPAGGAEAVANDDSQTIAGRVLVSISPVPDFDRLLSLDGALGRMSGVGNVTLADYAKEEVTFRVEVDPPISVEDFRSRLSDSAGSKIEVIASRSDGLALRLAS